MPPRTRRVFRKRSSRPRATAFSSTVLALCCLALPATGETESAFGPSSDSSIEGVEAPEPEPPGDGVYGRLRGDVSLQLGAGMETVFDTGTLRPLVTADLSVYQTLGLYASYRHAVMTRDPQTRSMSVGLDVSPLFLIRFPRSWETGLAVWDLTLDSLGVSAGLLMVEPNDGSLFDEVGAELGLGLGLPLLGRANGLWLRARGHVTKTRDWGGTAWVWLSWQGFVHMGLLNVKNP